MGTIGYTSINWYI